jgi:hypothetical protein
MMTDHPATLGFPPHGPEYARDQVAK